MGKPQLLTAAKYQLCIPKRRSSCSICFWFVLLHSSAFEGPRQVLLQATLATDSTADTTQHHSCLSLQLPRPWEGPPPDSRRRLTLMPEQKNSQKARVRETAFGKLLHSHQDNFCLAETGWQPGSPRDAPAQPRVLWARKEPHRPSGLDNPFIAIH